MKRELTDSEIRRKVELRLRGRTDLLFLCNELLDYPDVDAEVHGPILALPQAFGDYQGKDLVLPDGTHYYEPRHWDPHKVIPPDEPRNRLLLDPRGHLKTTVNVIAHGIQWILNYPDLCMLIVHAAESKSKSIVGEMKAHFTHNEKFRYLFPEYCPRLRKDIKAFGSTEYFTVPNRKQNRRHPTVEIGSMGKKMASSHYDVIKYTDIVDETTVTTPEQIRKTRELFDMGQNLRVSPFSWRDVEGTIYDESDLYCELIDEEWTKPIERGEEPAWKFSVRGVYKKDVPGGQKFLPDERDAPYLFAPEDIVLSPWVTIPKGDKIPWWAANKDGTPRFTPQELRKAQVRNEYIFACQQLLNPTASGKEKPFNPAKIQWVSKAALARIPVEYKLQTIDTAEKTGKRNDDSVITTGYWTRGGDLIIVDITFGKWLPNSLISIMFEQFFKYQPGSIDIEETGFVRGLKSSIQAAEAKRGVVLPLRYLARENDTSKKERIFNALQPPFASGRIKFYDGLPDHVKDRLKTEMSRFPSAAGHDDMLDTLADQYQFRNGFQSPKVYESVAAQMKRGRDAWLGISGGLSATLNEDEVPCEPTLTGML